MRRSPSRRRAPQAPGRRCHVIRILDGEETVVRDADGDEVVIYSAPGGRVGLGTQRAGEDGGFAVLLDRKGVAEVVGALLSRVKKGGAK